MAFPTSHIEVHCRFLVRKMDDEYSLTGGRSQVANLHQYKHACEAVWDSLQGMQVPYRRYG